MGETPEPPHGDPIPAGRTVPGGIPVARPIVYPGRVRVRRRNEAMLLGTSTPGAAWVDLGRFLLYIVLLVLVTEAVIGLAVPIFPDPDGLEGDWPDPEVTRALLFPLLTIRAVGSIAIIATILRHRRQPPASVGLERSGFRLNVLIGAGATLVVYVLIALTMPLLWLVWPGFWEQMEENADRMMDLVPKLHPLGFVGVAVMVGVYEELVFRGFLMTRLRRATGSWTAAVLISTAVFAGLHAFDQTLSALLWITILSLVFSAVTIWRRSIIPAIVGHTLFDWSQFLLLSVQAGDSWT